MRSTVDTLWFVVFVMLAVVAADHGWSCTAISAGVVAFFPVIRLVMVKQ